MSQSSRHPSQPKVPSSIWLAGIIVVGVILRFYRLDFQSLWQDEGLQYFVAHGDQIEDVMSRLHWRTWHPPLSFLINHVFLRIADTDFMLRLPSALFGIASLPLCYSVVKRLYDERVALYTTFVLAVSPFHIWYSQEGRMYAQLLFCFLVASMLLLMAVEQKRWWIGYLVAIAVGFYTHVFIALGILGHGVWLLFYHRRALLAYVATGSLVGILFLPWVFYFPWVKRFVFASAASSIKKMDKAIVQASGFEWEPLFYAVYTYASGFSLGPSVAELHADRSLRTLLQYWPEILMVGVIVGGLLLAGLVVAYRKYASASWGFTLIGFILPMAGALVFSLAPQGSFNVRYTIVALPFFCMLMGLALAATARRHRLLGLVALLLMLVVSGSSLVNHYTNPKYAKEDIRTAVLSWQATDDSTTPLLSFAPGGSQNAINRYLQPEFRDRHIKKLWRSNASTELRSFFANQDVSSVWVMIARDWTKAQEARLRRDFSIQQEHLYHGVTVMHVKRP